MNDFLALYVLAFLFLVTAYLTGQKEIMKAAISAFLLIQALPVAACIQLLIN